jgi:hypothetical protein
VLFPIYRYASQARHDFTKINAFIGTVASRHTR